jgi:hypothetical protein
MRRTAILVLRIVGAVALASTFTLHAFGQRGERVHDRDSNERDLEQRIFNLGKLGKRSGGNRRRDPNLTPKQLQEDFTCIQVLNNSLVEAMSRGGETDDQLVARSVSEIRMRAERLRDNLALPKPEKSTKQSWSGPVGLKASIAMLDELIIGFAHNPAFREARADDAELSVRARRDLEAIIELSGQIKKRFEQPLNSGN